MPLLFADAVQFLEHRNHSRTHRQSHLAEVQVGEIFAAQNSFALLFELDYFVHRRCVDAVTANDVRGYDLNQTSADPRALGVFAYHVVDVTLKRQKKNLLPITLSKTISQNRDSVRK